MSCLEHIKTLLRDHDRAFIPGFGGFVKEYVPARIDRSKELFLPPTCTISFNQGLAKEDGLLTQRIMEAEGKDFESSKEAVRDLANDWERQLEERKRIELKGIGILYRDEEGKTRFEPDPDPELETSAHGLEAFYVPPVRKPEEASDRHPGTEEVPQSTTLQEEEADPKKGERSRRILIRAAAIVLPLLILTGSALFGLKKLPENASLSEFLWKAKESPDYRPHRAIDTAKILSLVPKNEEERTPPFAFRMSSNGAEYQVVSEKVLSEASTPSSPKNSFFIVGGCFEVKANARDREKNLSEKGFPARILNRKRKGLYVVAIDAFTKKSKALKGLEQARKAKRNAWVLHRP
ncbi:MAG: SPOR domain-containing protein [Flavobacteriales bacterium]